MFVFLVLSVIIIDEFSFVFSVFIVNLKILVFSVLFNTIPNVLFPNTLYVASDMVVFNTPSRHTPYASLLVTFCM